MVFKIKVKDSGVDLRADTISIEIELRTIPYILGVKRQLSPPDNSPVWTRTDDSVNLVAKANQCDSVADFNNKGIAKDDFAMSAHGGSLYFFKDIDIVNMAVLDNASKGIKQGDILDRLSTNPNNFNWGATKDGEAVNIMTYYPGHYIKREQKDGWEYIQLSILDFDGAMYVEPYYRGTFEAIYDNSTFGDTESTRILRSYAGIQPTVSTTIANFRTYAGNNGMSIGDWRDFDFLCLYLIKYAHYNSQTQVGNGVVGTKVATDNNNAGNTLKGRDGYIGTNGSTSVWCLGLCNFWGNVLEFVDGITINNKVACVATNPDNYKDSAKASNAGYTDIGYINWGSHGYPRRLGYDSNNPLISFPDDNNSGEGNSSTGICDYYFQNTGERVVLRGTSCHTTTDAGAFLFNCYDSFSVSYPNCGCRLLKIA